MDNPLSMQNALQTRFTLEQAKAVSLEHQLKNHENKEDLMKTAKQFEGVFIQQLLSSMDKTVDRSDGIFESGYADDTFRGMFYERVADGIANKPGASSFGIADSIYKQLILRLPADQQDPAEHKPLNTSLINTPKPIPLK